MKALVPFIPDTTITADIFIIHANTNINNLNYCSAIMWHVFWCFVIVLISAVLAEKLPQVEIPLGKIEGLFDETVNGRIFNSFEGIPYATPPVGQLRFKEAIPPEPWNDTWRANTKYRCLQYNHFLPENDKIMGSEDCLYVNIYTPKFDANLDVIVFIHGGAFIFGEGTQFLPHILLDRDVIYVSLNYRLGPLGFLSTEDDNVPGNNGLKDQILALRWIKENIRYFGGNPDSITLSGMSAGGASVHFHMLSSKSRGLFNKAISMSGCMLNPWVIMENPLERTKELASIVECPTENIETMIGCLRMKPARQIVSVVRNFQPWLFNPFSPFGAVIDSWSDTPVLPVHPLELLRKGYVYDVPWILSHTTGEGLYPGFDFYPEENLKYINDRWDEIIPHILHYNYTVKSSLRKYVNSQIRNEYFGDQDIDRRSYNKLIDVIGDRLFKVDIDKCTRLHASMVISPVFHYLFDYRGAHSWTELRSGTTDNIGVSHADDTIYVLKTSLDSLSTEKDRYVSKIMVDLFVTFAKYGRPNVGIDWPEVSKNVEEPIKYLRISSSPQVDQSTEFGNKKFWDSMPFQETIGICPTREEL